MEKVPINDNRRQVVGPQRSQWGAVSQGCPVVSHSPYTYSTVVQLQLGTL